MKFTDSRYAGAFAPVPGLVLSLAVAIPAWFAGRAVPVIGGAVFAIAFGLGIGLFYRPARAAPGIRFASKKVLQWAIILLGFEMNIRNVLAVGSESLLVMLFTLTAAFAVAAVMWRVLAVPGNQAVLIGVGTCICGGSAIAATAPVIGADDRDVAQSVSTIFLFNVIAVFLFPALGRTLGLSDHGFGVWAGTAVNDTSSVVATASAWSEATGRGDALALATVVKLTRTLLIIPITLILAGYVSLRGRREGAKAGGTFRFAKIFPWFVLGFLAAAILNSLGWVPPVAARDLTKTGKFLIVVAMAAIGLSTDAKRLVASGWRPIALGLACWIAVALTSLAAQGMLGML